MRPRESAAWPTSPPTDLGLDPEALDGPLARLLEAEKTRAAVLIVSGKLAWERYFDGYGPASRFDTYSIAKGFTAAAVGLLAGDGRLSVDDPACRFLPEWAGDDRRAITIRHLLSMSSGLHLDYPGFTRDPDPTAALLRWPLDHPPGEVWCYEQATAHALAVIAERLSERSLLDFLRERLLDPLGAGEVGWLRRASGAITGWRSIYVTARDLARLGELLLREGRWEGAQLLPRSFVTRATAIEPLLGSARAEPATSDLRRRSYGWMMFANGSGIWEGVSRRGFALIGAWGNMMLVDPDRDFVFVRLVTPEGRVREDGEHEAIYFWNFLDDAVYGTAKLWRRVLAAFDATGLVERLDARRLDVQGDAILWARRKGQSRLAQALRRDKERR
ncbi:MAG: serine hydrolase domain-containing protein [Byssovorax sp.]